MIKHLLAWNAWRNRDRKVQRLLSFARTEAGGAIDIARAAAAASTPDLKKLLLRHATDEERHAELFRKRAREVFGSGDQTSSLPAAASGDLAPLSAPAERGRLSLNDHGFLPSDQFAALGELNYIAMLYQAECDAAADFAVHRRTLHASDPETAAVFATILHDEDFHVAYTRAQLKTWEKQGRRAEVRRALRVMRWHRIKSRLSLASQWLGDRMATIVLSLVYCTLFLPFGVIGALSRDRSGWAVPKRRMASDFATLRLER